METAARCQYGPSHKQQVQESLSEQQSFHALSVAEDLAAEAVDYMKIYISKDLDILFRFSYRNVKKKPFKHIVMQETVGVTEMRDLLLL